MVGTNARRVVTAVTDEHTLGDRPVRECPGMAVGGNTLSLDGEHTVTVDVHSSRPYPAVARLVHLLPEAFLRIGCKFRGERLWEAVCPPLHIVLGAQAASVDVLAGAVGDAFHGLILAYAYQKVA